MRSAPSAACCGRWPVADITDERLREIVVNGTYCGLDEGHSIAAELLAARAEVQRLRSRVGWLDHLDTPEGREMHGTEVVRVENEQLRAEVERLNRLLPLLMKLWDAAKEAAGTISMSQEHSCYHTYGFLDKEPALKMVDALEELRLWKKETP